MKLELACRRVSKKKIKTCEKCDNKIMLTEGGIMCELNYEIVVDEYIPTGKYLWCSGKMYEKE